ncbi:MAG: tetratricopeptide repeat protein [Pirellulaceae bacterium]|nr:tetratricopeptide repeat protein [Pirellulaceae bacterium]
MPELNRSVSGALLLFSIVGILAGVTFVYQAAFPGDFIRDDVIEISANYRMGNLTELVSTSSRGVKLPARPLAYASFSLSEAILGEKPQAFLAVNVIIHAVACLLLFRLLWLVSIRTDDAIAVPTRMLPIGALVSVWAVHPMNVHAVAYIYQRMESLMACLFLAASIQIVHYLRQPHWIRLVMATLFAVLAALSKEVAAVLPLAPFVISAVVAESIAVRMRRAAIVAMPLMLTWVAVAAYLVPQLDSYRKVVWGSDSSPWSYFMTESQVIVHYLKSFAWPDKLSLVYDWPTVTRFSEVMIPMTVLVILLLFGIYFIGRGWLIGTGVLWFFLVLGPSSSFLPMVWAAEDYRTYLPIVGLLIAIVAVVIFIEVRMSRRWVKMWHFSATAVILLCAVFMAIAGRSRATLFQSQLAIWTDAVKSERAPATAPAVLSDILIDLKNYTQAENFARKAIEAAPTKPKGWSSLASALTHQGQVTAAAKVLDDAMAAAKDDGSLAFAKGNLLAAKDTPAAIEMLDRAVSLDPLNESAWNNLGILLARDPATYEQAEECYQRSLSLRIDNRSAYQNLVALHIKSGELYDARTVLLAARKILPNDGDLRSRLATLERLIREQERQRSDKE